MTPNSKSAMITIGMRPFIWCPVCGKNAVAVMYNGTSGVAEYLHIIKNQEKWHVIQLSKI